MSTLTPGDTTPVENRGGMWYKREDLFRLPNGVNGGKLRATYLLLEEAILGQGVRTVISASSVRSPQSAVVASVARELGIRSVTVVGATTPEKAVRNKYIQVAAEAGSEIVQGTKVGYNPALQAAGREIAAQTPGGWLFPYGTVPPKDASREDFLQFLGTRGDQVVNIPDEVEEVVLPLGSGGSAMGVLHGLHSNPKGVRKVHLVAIGPDRVPLIEERLGAVGTPLLTAPWDVEVHNTFPHFAQYGHSMRETIDGIKMHPTYEGKIVRYFNLISPEFWVRRDGRTLFWIVGGPL